LAGYLIGNNPLNKKTRIFIVATFVGAFQAAFEAVVFYLFGDVGAWIALWSWFGNSVTHGIIMGAIPTIWLIPKFNGRIERYLGFPPRGKDQRQNRDRNQRRDRALAP
jgi:hypothetical protein